MVENVKTLWGEHHVMNMKNKAVKDREQKSDERRGIVVVTCEL